MPEREPLARAITRPVEPEHGPKGYYTSGSTMLNLAGSGLGRKGGWAKGRVVNLVGDGSSGKTALALECIAHARRQNPAVIVKYDNGEEVMDFDVREMFGLDYDIFLDEPSQTVEDFGESFVDAVSEAEGRELIYVLDSLDSLGSRAEQKRMLDAAKSGGDQDGSYNLERQKYMNQFFRTFIVNNMGDNVLLIIVSQVRARIGVTFGEKTYRTGGKALDFYTHQVCWLREKEKLKRQILGHTRIYGIRVEAKFKRNKIYKPFREAEFTILFDYGVDDIGSIIDWMWGPKAKEIEYDGRGYTRATLISMLEDEDREDELREMAERKWNEIEENFKPDRKSKF